MRIIVAHCRYRERGGEDSVVDSEVGLLRRYGHDVLVLAPDNRDLAGRARLATLADALWSFRGARDVARAIRWFRPDVAHVHNTFPQLSPSVYWAAAREGVPIVQTLHNFRLLCAQAMFLRDEQVCEACLGKLPWRGVVRRCYHRSFAQSGAVVASVALHRAIGSYRRHVTRFIALNEFCRDKFIAGGLPAARIAVKPNFVEDPQDAAGQGIAGQDAADQGAVPQAGGRTGLFVGRLSGEKGIEPLLAALDRLPDVRIDVVGTGPLEDRVRKHPRVRALGWLTAAAVHARMQRARYLLVPSLWFENFPRTIVEAFANSLPVIASDIGALREIVREGATGRLVPAGDPQAWARAIAWAQIHHDELHRMGAAARATYEAAYSPATNHAQLIAIYAAAIGERRRRRAA